jgi:CHAT domain-containing protein
LSACSSGQRAIKGRGTAEVPGDDLFGLQAAFFAAGAKRVIGSLWPVDSAATRPMMASLHRHLANGHIPEIALRSAILESIESDPAPFYWAPFFVSAVGRPVRAD